MGCGRYEKIIDPSGSIALTIRTVLLSRRWSVFAQKKKQKCLHRMKWYTPYKKSRLFYRFNLFICIKSRDDVTTLVIGNMARLCLENNSGRLALWSNLVISRASLNSFIWAASIWKYPCVSIASRILYLSNKSFHALSFLVTSLFKIHHQHFIYFSTFVSPRVKYSFSLNNFYSIILV